MKKKNIGYYRNSDYVNLGLVLEDILTVSKFKEQSETLRNKKISLNNYKLH